MYINVCEESLFFGRKDLTKSLKAHKRYRGRGNHQINLGKLLKIMKKRCQFFVKNSKLTPVVLGTENYTQYTKNIRIICRGHRSRGKDGVNRGNIHDKDH